MSRVQVMLVALSLVTLLPGVQGHGAVTKPWPRRGNQPMYCPWCIGEHNSANPYGQPHVNARPGSPCLGTNRGDAHYTGDSMGEFPSGPGPKTYTAGKSFQANIALSADHGGVAQWTYCPHTESETEECFKRHELTKWKDVHSYWGGDSSCDHCHDGESYPETVTLPNMPSGRITLRWMWVCKWTDELFASCIDVDVVGTGASPTRRRRSASQSAVSEDTDKSAFVQEAVEEEAASEESDDEVMEEASEEEGADGDEEVEGMDDEDMEHAIDEEDDITDDQEEPLEQEQEDTDDIQELSFAQEEAEEDQDSDDEHEEAEDEQDAEDPSKLMMQAEVDDKVRDEVVQHRERKQAFLK